MSWSNLLLMLLLAAGHAELLVTLINRVHALPIHCPTLRRLRHVHDAMIVLFPPVLLAAVGLGGPGLLWGGRWSEVPLGWQVYLGLCALGCVGLAGSAVRWLLRRLPRAQLSNDSWTVDIAERHGYRPTGEGPFHWMTALPRNEIFQIEASEKVYRLPRLPRDWDGLSILHLSDLHFIGTLDRPYFEQVAELAEQMDADLIVFTGDLLDRQELVEWVPSTLGRLGAPLGCFFILGNHDWEHGLDPEATRRRLSAMGWRDVAGRTAHIDHAGRTLAIGGSELPWMGTHPDFSDAPEEAFRLFLSHTPDHIGWARRMDVDLMLCGHNHGGQVVLPGIGPVYSPSRFGVRYASGPFWEDPTLLYVTRGISGRHPLRLNCPPELTKLVLRAPDSR